MSGEDDRVATWVEVGAAVGVAARGVTATTARGAGVAEAGPAACAVPCEANGAPDGADNDVEAVAAVTTPEAIDSAKVNAMVARPYLYL